MMTKIHKTDFAINVILPIGIGVAIYFLTNYFELNGFTRNHLPDFLWAWSLFSCMLIIWERRISTFWMAIVFAFCILFELLQHFHFISGTGDYMDVLVYVLAGAAALFANQYFFNRYKNNYDQTYQN